MNRLTEDANLALLIVSLSEAVLSLAPERMFQLPSIDDRITLARRALVAQVGSAEALESEHVVESDGWSLPIFSKGFMP